MSPYDDDNDDLDEMFDNGNWIYIGCDVEKFEWSKVGKTTNELHTRHRSSQNPSYCIYTAFNIVRGNVHEIEEKLLHHLEYQCGLERIAHQSTGNASECFRLNPDQMTGLVEQFIEEKFGSSVTYENSLHGEMSRYRCDDDIFRYFQTSSNSRLQPLTLQPRSLGKGSYFSGNKEIYEIDLGDDHYIDASSGLIRHRADD